MSATDKLIRAKVAIQEVFGDTSCSQQTTLKILTELAGDIELYRDALQADIDRDETT